MPFTSIILSKLCLPVALIIAATHLGCAETDGATANTHPDATHNEEHEEEENNHHENSENDDAGQDR